MCGRFALTLPPESVRRLFGFAERPNFPPRYNIAPTQPIAIVRGENAERHFALARWGLIPSWVKDLSRFPLLINARQTGFSRRHAPSPLPHSRRWVL